MDGRLRRRATQTKHVHVAENRTGNTKIDPPNTTIPPENHFGNTSFQSPKRFAFLMAFFARGFSPRKKRSKTQTAGVWGLEAPKKKSPRERFQNFLMLTHDH